MPDIETLDVLTINCNTIDGKETDKADKGSTNTATCQGSRCEQHYTNMMQEAETPKKCYSNTDSNQTLDSKDKPMVIANEKENKLFPFMPQPR